MPTGLTTSTGAINWKACACSAKPGPASPSRPPGDGLGSGAVEGFGVGERAAQPGMVRAQDADLEVRLPLRLGRSDVVGGAELESEPAVVGRVAEQRGQRLAECVGRAQDGVHERAAGAVPLAVRADG